MTLFGFVPCGYILAAKQLKPARQIKINERKEGIGKRPKARISA